MTQSKQRLFDLINSTDFPPIPLSDNNVVLTGVTATTEQPGWNTRLSVQAIDNKGYSGERTLFMRRLDLSLLGDGLVIGANLFSTPRELCDVLNNLRGSFIDPEDLLAFDIPVVLAGQTTPLVLTADPASFGWIGSVTLRISGTAVLPDCNGPLLPIPTLTDYSWWTTVNQGPGRIYASRYGGLITSYASSSIVGVLNDLGESQFAVTFTSQTYPDGVWIDAVAPYQDHWVVATECAQGSNWVLGLAYLDRNTGSVLSSRFLDMVPANTEGTLKAVAVDGCVFIGGYDYNNTDNSQIAVVVKVRLDGEISWQKTLQVPAGGAAPQTQAELITALNDNNVYAVLSDHGTAQWWVVKYGDHGVLQWQRELSPLQYNVNAVVLSDASLVVGAQHLTNTTGVVLRLNPATGATLWCKEIASTGGVIDIAADAQNNLYVLSDGLLIKMDANGNELWSRTWSLSGSHSTLYNWESMEVRGGQIYAFIGDTSTNTSALLSLPTDGSGTGVFNLPDAQLSYDLNVTNHLSDGIGLITNAAGALVESIGGFTISAGDVQTLPATAPAPNWTAPRALSDPGPVLTTPVP